MPGRKSNKMKRVMWGGITDADGNELAVGNEVYIVDNNTLIKPESDIIRIISSIHLDPNPGMNESHNTVTLMQQDNLPKSIIPVSLVVLADNYQQYNNSVRKKQQHRENEVAEQRTKDETNRQAAIPLLLEQLNPGFSSYIISHSIHGNYDLQQIVEKIIDQIGVNELIKTSTGPTEPVQFKSSISFTISDEFGEKSILNNIKLTDTSGICLTLNMYNINKYYYFYVFIHENKPHVVLLTLPPINASNQSDTIPTKYTEIGNLTDDKKNQIFIGI